MRRITLLVVGVLLLGILAACGTPNAPTGDGAAGNGGPIKVGAIFDLTGATSDVGVAYANGIKAYTDYFNKNGGANGRTIELISQDYAYKVENAERLYSQYVNQDKVVAMIGWGTGDTEALRPKIANDKIPFTSASLSETLTNINDAPYNFVIGVNYSDQMRIALQYILEQKNNAQGLKVAFLYNDSPFGKSPEPALNEIAQTNGMEVLAVAMPRGATDLTAQMQQVQSFGPEFVVIQNTAGPAVLALKNANTIGLKTQFIMLNFAANEILINQAGAQAEGVIGTLPFAPPSADPAAAKVINDYLKSTNQGSLTDNDKGLLFGQGWGTMSVMAEGIKRAVAKGEVTGEAIRAELEGLQNFDTGGITAPITFGPSDHQGATSLRMYQVNGGKWVPITEFIEAKK